AKHTKCVGADGTKQCLCRSGVCWSTVGDGWGHDDWRPSGLRESGYTYDCTISGVGTSDESMATSQSEQGKLRSYYEAARRSSRRRKTDSSTAHQRCVRD